MSPDEQKPDMPEPRAKLPASWAAPTMAQVGSIRVGRQRSHDKQTGRFPTKYLRAANIVADGLDLADVLEMDFSPLERKLYELRDGDLVLAEASGSAAHVGRAAIWHDEIEGCCFQNTVIRFRPHATTSEYALTVFRQYAAAGTLANIARGVGILHLGASRLARATFPLPPLAEQKRITAEVDHRLAELREAEESLRSALRRIGEQETDILAAAVSGDLVATEAALATSEGRQFEAALDTLVQSGVFANREAAEKAQLQGGKKAADDHVLPSGWALVKIAQVGEVTLGKMREPKRHFGPNMRPYLRVANVFEDRIDATDVLEMNFTPEEQETYALQYGDVLLNEGQSPQLVGRPAMYRDEVPGACFQKTLLRFRAGPAVTPEWALLVFRHYLHAGEFQKVAHWSTNIAHLTRQTFIGLPFPVPPLAEQKRIVEEAKERLEASKAQEAAVRMSLERLPTARLELLSAAIAGELLSQDPQDETAAALLERVGSPPGDALPTDADKEDSRARREAMSKLRQRDGAASRATALAAVIRSAGRPLRLPDLFSRAGYDRDSTEDVEEFYLALRVELGSTILTVAGDSENSLIEVNPDAPQ